jgi:hypothetical protein
VALSSFNGRRIGGRFVHVLEKISRHAGEKVIARREYQLPTRDEVLDAASERVGRGVTPKLHDVGKSARILGIGSE